MNAQPNPERLRLLRLIHMAARQMALDEPTYRALLTRVTGADSARDLDVAACKRVVDEFQRLGWKPKRHRSPMTGADWVRGPLLKKIEAQLADAKRAWAYADGIAQRMFGLDSLRFCDAEQLRKVVAALSYDQKRRSQQPNPAQPE